ncbi:DUF2777 family protein [Alkalicoccobacillus plakortidis]|uniref:DUF2777 domain-containing protein n=1 Tax=Alkalicoccobacillus plakortidis TaxID=444060 RepID=A0ABT0XER6_9BACI|nr:DUF2777 family protein [Alkalicoccobacillus plakortidis]MCM2674393.1 DUF2777 domain-containing protein [Alkalicoccobacillus plakortidis]
MDRVQAHKTIGKKVIVDEGSEGRYLGELLEVITEPKRPWKGKVKITSVLVLPQSMFSKGQINVNKMKYKESQLTVVQGQKIEAAASTVQIESFAQSIATGLRKKYQQLKKQPEGQAELLQTLEQYMNKLKQVKQRPDRPQKPVEKPTESMAKYTLQANDSSFYFINDHGEILPLTGSTFEFTWNHHSSWYRGKYEANGIFVSHEGQRFTAKEGDVFYMDEQQFNPYFIWKNELEPTALSAFQNSLAAFGLSDDELTHCHNSLLNQLLGNQQTDVFKGVSFLTFTTPDMYVLVQHHFDRTLYKDKEDQIYDRFEFTTDKGERSVVFYSNAFSK